MTTRRSKAGASCRRSIKNWQALRAGIVLLASLALAVNLGSAQAAASPVSTNNTLIFAGQPICTFRATLNNYSPQERTTAASARLHLVFKAARHMLVTTQAVPSGIQLTLDGQPLFVITPQDVAGLRGESVEATAAEAAAALRNALQVAHSLSTPGQILAAVGWALLGLLIFAAGAWTARQTKRWLLKHLTRLAARKTQKAGASGLRTAGLRALVAVLRAAFNFTFYLFIGFLTYALVWYELRSFPYTRPWGDYLRSECLSALRSLGHGALEALPGLAVVALVVLAARLLAQVLARVFAAVERGELRAQRLDPVMATTTRRLLIFVVWIIAAVVAYPYIPGSQSLAFKGVTVFAGLIISLGSTNIVSQVASGLLLIYSRAFRAGDYVRIDETEGTVLTIGLCATHIRTIKNEEVYIANSVLLGSTTKNYSRLAQTEGLLLPVKVTIGYNAPWRQVHAMLLEAARRTPGLAQEPPPFVLQTSLSDFYVDYELNARLEQPHRRMWVQSDLQANIQDVFNEYGVQIMSPHYLQDPAKPHVVPKADWFLPPAMPERATELGAQRDLSQASVRQDPTGA
jgi:small-conductance mechanosensitive channel